MRRWKDELALCQDWTKKAGTMNVVCKGTKLSLKLQNNLIR